jgi:TonB family protein
MSERESRSNAWIWIVLLVIGVVVGCGVAAVGVAVFAGMYTVRSTQERVLEAERAVYAREDEARREAERRMDEERAAVEEAQREAEQARAEAERALAAGENPADPLAGVGEPRGTDGQGVSISELPDSPVPRVTAGSSEVRGSLSAEVIRRVVRRHINEVRFCYEQELTRNPTLAGRVVVTFVISPTGDVPSSSVASSTMANARLEGCLVRAVRRWNFPAPEGGGIVTVNYPFDFSASN